MSDAWGVSRAWRAWTSGVALGALAGIGWHPLPAQTKAMTLAEVIDLRKQGVSTRQILRNAKTYCIAFAMDDSSKQELAGAGADTGLVQGLGDVCSTQRARPKPLLTLIDDDFAHTLVPQAFTWADRGCVSRFEPTGVRIENRRIDAMCLLRYPSSTLSGDVRIELTVNQFSTDRDGELALGFGMGARSTSYFAVQVNARRRVQLCWITDGQCGAMLSHVATDSTGDARSDTYAVELRGREIAMFMNGVRIGTYTADQPIAGQLSIGVGASSVARLARLRVSALN